MGWQRGRRGALVLTEKMNIVAGLPWCSPLSACVKVAPDSMSVHLELSRMGKEPNHAITSLSSRAWVELTIWAPPRSEGESEDGTASSFCPG